MKNKLLKVALVVFLGAFSLGFFTGAITEFTLTKNYKVISEIYTVKQGDTFMDICLEYRKLDQRDPYIFEYMDEIRKLNPQLKENHNQLDIGDELKIQYKVNQDD